MIKPISQLFDMSIDGNDTSNRMCRFVGVIVAGFVWLLLKVLFRFSVENRKVIYPFKGKTTGAVIVGPHTSYIDVVMMFMASWPSRWTRLIARESLFSVAGGLLGFIIARVGAFPVKRNSADMSTVKRASKFLKNGEFIGIFPEGTRRGKGSSEPSLHGGAALIARMGKAPLIPLGLVNADVVKRKGERLRFPKLTAIYGDPVALSSFDFLPKEDRLDGATWYVLRESFALSRGVLPIEVNMAELFPESKDFSEAFATHEIPVFDPSTLPDYVNEESKG